MKKIAKIGKESLIVLFLLIISLSISGIGTRAFGLNQAESPNYQANIIIDQTIGGSYLDYAYSVINTSDGGFALAGYTYSDGAGSSDMWLVKTDDTGQMEWERYRANGMSTNDEILSKPTRRFLSLSFFSPLVIIIVV